MCVCGARLVGRIIYAGRVMEEVQQFYSSDPWEYFQGFWNVVDAILFIFQGTAFVLRIVVISKAHSITSSDEYVSSGLQTLNQLQFDFQVWGLIALIVRYVEILTYSRELGEVFFMLKEMVREAVAVIAYMLLFAISAGIAFSVGLPNNVQYGHFAPPPPPPGLIGHVPELHSYHPAFAGLWATLGEVDGSFLNHIYESSSESRNRFNWLPILMWLETFVTTIFLVNLMIAKMTSTYERIRSESLYYRAHQRCEFIIEFKDERAAPPPFNLITPIVNLLPNGCVRRTLQLRKGAATRGFSVLMGRLATRRVHSRERLHAQMYDEARMRQEAMRTDERVATLSGETMPAVKAVVQHVDGQVERLTTTVDALASTVAVLQEKVEAMSPSAHNVANDGPPPFGGGCSTALRSASRLATSKSRLSAADELYAVEKDAAAAPGREFRSVEDWAVAKGGAVEERALAASKENGDRREAATYRENGNGHAATARENGYGHATDRRNESGRRKSVTQLRHAGVDLVKQVAARAEADLEARAAVSAAARAQARAQEDDTESVLREVACAHATLERRQHTRIRVRGARKSPRFERGAQSAQLLSVSDIPEEPDRLVFESAPIPAAVMNEARPWPSTPHCDALAPSANSEAGARAGQRVHFAAAVPAARTVAASISASSHDESDVNRWL